MSSFYLIEADSFDNNFQANATKAAGGVPAKDSTELFRPIRRPYRGIQIKEDTYAVLSIRRADGTPIPVFTSSSTDAKHSGMASEYADFIIQQIDDNRQEKQQIIETFGDPYIYFYGEKPRIVTMSGVLVSSEDFNWRSQFWRNYDEFLRGTRLVQMNARAFLAFDTIVIEGYPLSAQAQDSADSPYLIPFQMTMVVTNYNDFSSVTSQKFPAGAIDSINTLNKALSDPKNQYISTTAQVRAANLRAMGTKGILEALRTGIRAVNTGMSIGMSFVNTGVDIIAGRNIRIPLGVAGYLASIGEATYAVGSINASPMSVYDAATGTYKNLMGSVKIRVPGSTLYAPVWTSDASDEDGFPMPAGRGYIYENYDEYPLRNFDKAMVTNMILHSNYAATANLARIQADAATRQVTYAGKEAAARAYANTVELVGKVTGAIAETVAFARSSFGMIMNAKALVNDPLAVTMASLGIGIGVGRGETGMNLTTSKEFKRAEFMKSTVGKYVGFSAATSFYEQTQRAAREAQKITQLKTALGQVYENSQYKPRLASAATKSTRMISDNVDDMLYEEAYGKDSEGPRDYTDLVKDNPATKSTLSQIHGDKDPESGSDVTAAALESVYGKGKSKPVKPSAKDRSALKTKDNSTPDQPADADTSGIRGVADDSAPIPAVV